MSKLIKLYCPYCGGTIRINTKRDSGWKQAGCQEAKCGAKGPLSKTNELARQSFGMQEGDLNWP